MPLAPLRTLAVQRSPVWTRFDATDPDLVLYLPLWSADLKGDSFYSKDSYAHLCTVTGALWTPQGRHFDGVDDKIAVPYHSVFQITAEVTVEA
jgi:hypothetical protein